MAKDIAARAAKNDLTQGPIMKKLLMFALPTIAGNLVSQLYNIADSIIVGNFAPNGAHALAAVGASFSVMFLFNALFNGVSMGAQIVISQMYGAKDYDRLQKALNTSMTLAIALGIFIMAVGTPLAGPLLKMLNTPAELYDDAWIYLVVVFLGQLGNVYFFLGSGAMRGMGDSRWPLYAMILASVTNVILDLVFVIAFNWGVFGVAFATTISHWVSGIMIAIRLNRKGAYAVGVQYKQLIHPDKGSVKHIVRLGLPSGIQQMASSLGSMVIQTFSNGFGADFLAANTVIMKADGFAVMPMFGLGAAVTTFVGQNIGAGQADRARKGVYSGIIMTVIMSAAVGVALWFCGGLIMQAFGCEGEILNMGIIGIRILAFFYMFMGMDMCIGGAMRGAGAAVPPMISALASNVSRIPIAYVIAVLPLKEAVEKILGTVPLDSRVAEKAQAYLDQGLYETVDEAQQAAAPVIASADTGVYQGMFYSMAASMVVGAAISFIFFKFTKWQERGITGRGPGGPGGPGGAPKPKDN